MHVGVPYDSTKYIEDAINEVVHTLAETLLIVVCVIFLFLGSFRSVLIPVVAIPISLIGTAFLMLAFGFTLNLLTLLAIVLSVGLVVDDAIVVVENVERHMHEGESPFLAALHGARELVGPIIAMTITLIAVYAPIGIQGGLTGALFREFAFTLAGAVTVSGVVALTLSPMLGSKLLKPGADDRGFAGWINRRFESVRRIYTRLLIGTLEFRAITLTVAALAFLLIPIFYFMSTKELAPKEDQGVIFGAVQASPNSTLDQTTLYTRKFLDRVQLASPRRSTPSSSLSRRATQAGFSGMVIKPWSERQRTTTDLLPIVTAGAAAVPGHRRGGLHPAAAARRQQFRHRVRHRLHGRPARAARLRQETPGQADGQPDESVLAARPQVRPAAGQGDLRPGQGRLARVEPGSGRRGPLDDAGRQLRQPLFHRGPLVQGDPAGHAPASVSTPTSSSISTCRARQGTNSCRCPRSRTSRRRPSRARSADSSS